MREYVGRCSAKQLHDILLLSMGIRFEEIRASKPGADPDAIYLPQPCLQHYFPDQHGWRCWRVGFNSPKAADKSLLNFPVAGKARRVSGVSADSIQHIRKQSGSGNIFLAGKDYGEESAFVVNISQHVGVPASMWFDFARIVGIELTPEGR